MAIKNKKQLILYSSMVILGALIIHACHTYSDFRSNYQDANTLLHATENLKTKPFLKAHLRNGDICILTDTWEIDTLSNSVAGHGIKYDINRDRTYKGIINVPIDSVAIFETNKKIVNPEEGKNCCDV